MNKTVLAIFFAFLICQSLSCDAGWYQPASGKCQQCPAYATQCADTTGAPKKLVDRLKGYQDVSGTLTAYCSNNKYNSADNVCEHICKDGCLSCMIDYDFCESCHGGYVWNPDYTCLPAVVGLEAASLALLVIALIFSVIGCCYVNKARK